MKYLLLASLLLGVTATPVKQRQATQAKISRFSASSDGDAGGAEIGYSIEIPGLVSTHCSYADANPATKLPDVSQTPCDNPVVRWQFRQDPSRPGTEGRYRIVMIYAPPSGPSAAGFHEWDPSDFPEESLDAEYVTVYHGAPDFIIDIA
ncbi:hypothetical protein F5Y03DRAFT_393823 [Xylaria venustula]|nr:hypothetical protein F5Y03DRAFT_393823 [Xylaria venustula]